MAEPLEIFGEDPLVLRGAVDSSDALQLEHGNDSLANHDQTLYAAHEDLEEETGVIQIRLSDLTVGTVTWMLTASHLERGSIVQWPRDGTYAYYDFGPLTSEQEIDISATSDGSAPQTKKRTILIKTLPTDPLSARRRR